MRELSERLGESCSAAILQGNDIVYVARVPARRIMSAALSVGSRLPALHTALGRIMFGYLDDAEIWRRLKSQRIEAYTPQTITDLQALFDRIRADRAQGFSIVDEELERGLRAIGRAGARSQRTGRRRHQPVDALDAHDAQRNARAFSPRAQPHRRADLIDDLSEPSVALANRRGAAVSSR